MASESTRLLGHDKETDIEKDELLLLPHSFWDECAYILNLAWPGSLTAFFSFSTAIVNTAMIGHINNEATYVSAASLSSMFLNVTGYSIGFGMTGGLSTLGGQAFGAKAYHRVGVLMQRTILIELVLAIPIMLLWLGSFPVLQLANLDQEITLLACQYIAISAVGFIPSVLVEVFCQFLYCQQLVRPPIPVQVVVNIFNVVCCYVVIFSFGWGFLGGAWAAVFSQILGAVCMGVVALWYGHQTWGGLSSKAFEQLWPLTKLSVGSTVMMCSEWWSFEFVGFSTGYIGPNGATSLATWGVIWQIVVILFMVSLGLADAMTIRISNLLGAGKASEARHSALVGTELGLILSFILSCVIFVFRKNVAQVWTEDEEIVEKVSELLPYLCLFEIGDTVQGIIGGIATGMGMQTSASIARIFSFYGVGLPITWVLTFYYELGLTGTMMGITISPVVCSLILLSQIFQSDWAAIADEAQRTALEDK